MKNETKIFLCLLGAFLACCLIALLWGNRLDNEYIAYPILAIWGLSGLLWPIFLVRFVRGFFKKNDE